MGEGKANAQHPAEHQRSPQGGVKGVQDQGMREKSEQVKNLPEEKINPGVTSEPDKR